MMNILTKALKLSFAVCIIAIAIAAIYLFKSSPVFLGALIIAGSSIVMWQGFIIAATMATFISTVGSSLHDMWVSKKVVIPSLADEKACKNS